MKTSKPAKSTKYDSEEEDPYSNDAPNFIMKLGIEMERERHQKKQNREPTNQTDKVPQKKQKRQPTKQTHKMPSNQTDQQEPTNQMEHVLPPQQRLLNAELRCRSLTADPRSTAEKHTERRECNRELYEARKLVQQQRCSNEESSESEDSRA